MDAGVDGDEDALLLGFDESQWASSSYVLCALSIDCVITLTLVLFSFTGTLKGALLPSTPSVSVAIASNLLDLCLLCAVRVANVTLNLLVPNSLCVTAHFMTFVVNVVMGVYVLCKFVLLARLSERGIIDVDGTSVSVVVVALALVQGQCFAWLEWWMTTKYRSTLSKIITKAYSRRISDLTAYEIASQSNRTPMEQLDRWNSNPNAEPLLGQGQAGYSSMGRPVVGPTQSDSDRFEFQDAISELSTLRSGFDGQASQQPRGSQQKEHASSESGLT